MSCILGLRGPRECWYLNPENRPPSWKGSKDIWKYSTTSNTANIAMEDSLTDDSENGDMVLTTSFSGSAIEEQNNDEQQFSGSAFTDNSISQGLDSILITLKPSRLLYFLVHAGHAAQTLATHRAINFQVSKRMPPSCLLSLFPLLWSGFAVKFTRQLWDFLVAVLGLDGDHGKSG